MTEESETINIEEEKPKKERRGAASKALHFIPDHNNISKIKNKIRLVFTMLHTSSDQI